MAYNPPRNEFRRKAYDEGYGAARDGLTEEACPYEPSGHERDTTLDDEDRRAWSDGFMDYEGPSASAESLMGRVQSHLATLPPEQRVAFFDEIEADYCRHCGGDPRCQCWNDE